MDKSTIGDVSVLAPVQQPALSGSSIASIAAKLPADEEQRLRDLHQLNILDTPAEDRFDRITRLVAEIFDVPIALVSLIDQHRQWFKSRRGIAVSETSREVAFCAHALHEPEILVVPDALDDPRFRDNPLVLSEPYMRFYAGATIQSLGCLPLGTLCIIDSKPREFSRRQQQQLVSFARIIESELNPEIGEIQDRAKSQLAAHIDPITGFFSYQEFTERCRIYLHNRFKEKGEERALNCCGVTLQLPQLENIQRSHGLRVADDVVAVVAHRLTETLIDDDAIFCRQARGYFHIFLPESSLSGNELGRLLTSELCSHRDLPESVPALNIRIGISPCVDSVEVMFNQCDFALAQLAEEPGIAYSYFAQKDYLTLERTSKVGMKLMDAIKEDSLQLYYQPKVSARDHVLVGVEALLHWHDAELGDITPEEIFEAAGKINLISEVDDWVLARACRQIAIWSEVGSPAGVVAVNLSGHSLKDAGLAERLHGIIAAVKIDPAMLQIEIVENSVITDFERILPELQRINALGVSFALDDFGTGYSSLHYLQRLPIRTVKLDHSFVNEIVSNRDDATLTAGIISLAHGLNLEVVAEGVETREQLAMLQSFDCDSIQGFVFSEARASADIEKLFAGHEVGACSLQPR